MIINILLVAATMMAGCSEYSINGEKPAEEEPLVDVELNVVNDPVDEEEKEVEKEVTPDKELSQEPVADAGPDAEVKPLLDYQLSGLGSSDPNGQNLEYLWTMVDWPIDSTTMLSNDTAAEPYFFVDVAGDYTFELTVMNMDGVWDATPDTVVISAVPSDDFYVQLSWDTEPTDLDLHLLNGSGALFEAPG
ncbi:MAG: hypothetical protein HN348_25270, partial [Proteobacteria bacterium]|nr:hypothetical protein [Pseudomonadota bacterium]